MISLGLTKLFTSARFVLPQDNIHPKFKKRKSESLRSVVDFFTIVCRRDFCTYSWIIWSCQYQTGVALLEETRPYLAQKHLPPCEHSQQRLILVLADHCIFGKWASPPAGWGPSKACFVVINIVGWCRGSGFSPPSPSPLSKASMNANPLFKHILPWKNHTCAAIFCLGPKMKGNIVF